MKIFNFVYVALCVVSVSGTLIPADRLVTWTPSSHTGVPGGIPVWTNLINVANVPYSADTNGVSDSSVAIQAAVTAAGSNDVIYMPAGTYKWTNVVVLKNYTALRGAGMSNTIVDYRYNSGGAIRCGSDSDYQWNQPGAPSNIVVSGSTQGSSNLVLNFGSSTWIGHIIRIDELNDTNLPVISVVAYQRLRTHHAVVKSVSGTNITIWPPMCETITNSAQFAITSFDGRWMGVEDMTINMTNSTAADAAVNLKECSYSWIKNVKVRYNSNYSFYMLDSVQCEMRGCWADKSKSGGSNHAGLLFASSTGCLVEDNIFDDIFPGVEVNFGSSGNVFGYNLILSSQWGGQFNMNHSPHNQHNLVEGNVLFSYQSDGYFGSEGPSTLFRNWLHGIYTGGSADGQNAGFTVLKLNRFIRNASFVGNIVGNTNVVFAGNTNSSAPATYYGQLSIGKPNIGNEGWNGSYGPPWLEQSKYGGTYTQSGTTVTASGAIFAATNVFWFLTDTSTTGAGLLKGSIDAYTSSTVVTLSIPYTVASPTAFAISPGSGGWQELDTNVYVSAIFKANFYQPVGTPIDTTYTNVFGSPTNPDVSLGGDTVPASLYYTSVPSFISTYTTNWPVFATNSIPSGSLSNNLALLPALGRYYNSSGGGGSTGGGTSGGSTGSSYPPVGTSGNIIFSGNIKIQ